MDLSPFQFFDYCNLLAMCVAGASTSLLTFIVCRRQTCWAFSPERPSDFIQGGPEHGISLPILVPAPRLKPTIAHVTSSIATWTCCSLWILRMRPKLPDWRPDQ